MLSTVWLKKVSSVTGDCMDINEKMKRDWNRRAKVDSKYWVAATEEADESSYEASAEKDVQAFLDGLGDRVSAEGKVLDLGCGIGRMTAPLAKHFKEVVGVDVADEMIKDAQRLHSKIDNLTFLVNDGSSLADLQDGNFDLVLSYSVLPHLPLSVCEQYFKEVNRILKPGGWFRFQFWIGDERRMSDSDTLNIRVYSERQFSALNDVAGLTVESREEIDYYDPVLALKPVWVNAQKSHAVGESTLFTLDTDKPADEAELDLEYGLLLYLAFKHHDRGEVDEAERVFEEAVHAAPLRPDAYIQWATIRVEKDDVPGGLTLFESLCEQAPSFSPGWLFRAQLLEALERLDEARACVAEYESRGKLEEMESQYAALKSRIAG